MNVLTLTVPLGTDDSEAAAKSAVATLLSIFGDDVLEGDHPREEAKTVSDEKAEETAAQKKKRLAAEKKAKEEAEAAAKEAEDAEKEEDASESEAEDSSADGDGPTREDVRAALKDYAALEGKEAAIALLKDAGASSMSELKESKFQEVIDACG